MEKGVRCIKILDDHRVAIGSDDKKIGIWNYRDWVK